MGHVNYTRMVHLSTLGPWRRGDEGSTVSTQGAHRLRKKVSNTSNAFYQNLNTLYVFKIFLVYLEAHEAQGGPIGADVIIVFASLNMFWTDCAFLLSSKYFVRLILVLNMSKVLY